MRDLEMPILPHAWTKILSERVKCQQNRRFSFFLQILKSKKLAVAKMITRNITSPDEAFFVCYLMLKYKFGVLLVSSRDLVSVT